MLPVYHVLVGAVLNNFDEVAKFFRACVKSSAVGGVFMIVATLTGLFVRDCMSCCLYNTVLNFMPNGVDACGGCV